MSDGDELLTSSEQVLVPFGAGLVSVVAHTTRPPKPARGTVFCFHGFTGNAKDFQPLARLLASNGFRVVCPDMIGRGASGYFARAEQYGFANVLKGALAVLDLYHGGRNACVGVGWGGLIGLVAAQSRPDIFNRIVISDLNLRYRIAEDMGIADARAFAGRRFGTVEEALVALSATDELGGAMANHPKDFAHRVRRVDGGQFALNCDDAISSRFDDYAGREFDIGQLIEPLADRCLLVNRAAKPGAASQRPPAGVIEVGRPSDWRGNFRDPGERLLALGFLLNRQGRPVPPSP